MKKEKAEELREINEKSGYIGLDIKNIPERYKNFEPLQFRISKTYDEKKYKQYRYINVNDIEILISPTDRLDSIQNKYKNASPICEYLDKKIEENLSKYNEFIEMIKKLDVQRIEKIEKEQTKLNKRIPFKVRFESNYLWQIYYSDIADKYFMMVPSKDIDYSTLFYLMKKQIEGKRSDKIFVPIVNAQYSNEYLRKSEFEDVENYLWLFTKDYPSIYEVYDKNNELSVQIVGETSIYERIKTHYKITLKNKVEANEFYKLIKLLFILQTELPSYYEFKTNINEDGQIEFYLDEEKIEYKDIISFTRQQFKLGIKKKSEISNEIKKYRMKLKKLQTVVATQEIEYIEKEKQISTFLECKKSFFGKVKYYIKYNKKNNGKNIEVTNINEIIDKTEKKEEEKIQKTRKKIPIKKVYTLEELITSYKELRELEDEMKKLLMDINALKLKNKNLSKKIENATMYIKEIDSHKKSIFEFWKYTNKDEIAVLPEGEEEEVNVIKKIEKTFDYENDLEQFGKKLDEMQRKNLSREQADSIFIASTDLIELLSEIKNDKALPAHLEKELKILKREQKDEEFDVFGGLIEDSRKIKKINDKKHREIEKDKFSILELNKNTKVLGLKKSLENVVKNISDAMENQIIPEDLPIYKAVIDEGIRPEYINVFEINPEKEMKEIVQQYSRKINFYKFNIKEGIHGVGMTNIIFYDNKNRTLPLGMDLSTKVIVDLQNLKFELKNKKSINIIRFENENDEFSDIEIKPVEIFEYDIVTENAEENVEEELDKK